VEGQRSLYERLAHMPARALKKAPGISNAPIFLQSAFFSDNAFIAKQN
jgi:hypothetical protein